MERERFLTILRELQDVCMEVNSELAGTENGKVIYEVLQFSDLARNWDSVYNIADFYNHNWLGNVDFMHIPNFMQVIQNCKSYPIIIAKEKDTNQLLGISTIKYDENTEGNVDPYFPERDAKYFSITGILVKKDNPHRGMGKKIYEIALRGTHNYEKIYPGTSMMCVIDCRNRQSLRALASAVDLIRANGCVGEGKELPVNICGYYELRDKESNELLEAPTLVIDIGLNARDVKLTDGNDVLDYHEQDGEDLFNGLLGTLRSQFNKYGISEPVIKEDIECGMVYYYSLQDKERCQINGIEIHANGTEKGNDRVPVRDEEMHSFIGPMPPISIDEER